MSRASLILFLFLQWDSENMLKEEEVTARQSIFPYLTYRSGALLDWKGDSITNHHCGLRLRHGGAHITENPVACDEVTWRSRDGSKGPVFEDSGSKGSGTP